jgi:hypothetical protein
MNIYIDKKNNVLIKGTNTKDSKFLKKNYKDLDNINLIFGNFTLSYGDLYLNLDYFNCSKIITATQWYKEFYL